MKPIILRKPKFMRDDSAMKMYIDVANTISNEMCRPELTSSQRLELLCEIGNCIRNAAKAGGFRNVGDMHKYLKRY